MGVGREVVRVLGRKPRSRPNSQSQGLAGIESGALAASQARASTNLRARPSHESSRTLRRCRWRDGVHTAAGEKQPETSKLNGAGAEELFSSGRQASLPSS